MELIVEGVNIPALSDDELTTKLRSLGFPVGPIVESTRRVYQLKLARLLRNEDASDSEEGEEKGTNQKFTPSNHLQSEAVDDSPSVSLHSTPSTSFDRSPLSPLRYDELKRRPLPRIGATSWNSSPSTLRSPLTADGFHSKVFVPPNKGTNKTLISTGVKIAILVCVLLFAILVYHNMESSAANPVPEFSVP